MSSPTAVTQSSVSVGSHAHERMRQLGWEVDTGSSFQLSAERLEDASFSVARVWHSPAQLRRPESSLTDSIFIMVGIDGTGTVRTPDEEWHLGPRQMIVVDSRVPLHLTFPEASARLEVRTERRRLGPIQLLLQGIADRIDVEESYWRTLASLIITVLGTGITADDSGFVSLKAAIESSIAAAIAQSPTGASASGNSTRALRARAQQIIEERFMDDAFSATELARSLAISSAHLHRIFADASATPYQMIQQRRLTRAYDLLHTQQFSDSAIAARSGFSSSRAMKRALHKHQSRGSTD